MRRRVSGPSVGLGGKTPLVYVPSGRRHGCRAVGGGMVRRARGAGKGRDAPTGRRGTGRPTPRRSGSGALRHRGRGEGPRPTVRRLADSTAHPDVIAVESPQAIRRRPRPAQCLPRRGWAGAGGGAPRNPEHVGNQRHPSGTAHRSTPAAGPPKAVPDGRLRSREGDRGRGCHPHRHGPWRWGGGASTRYPVQEVPGIPLPSGLPPSSPTPTPPPGHLPGPRRILHRHLQPKPVREVNLNGRKEETHPTAFRRSTLPGPGC